MIIVLGRVKKPLPRDHVIFVTALARSIMAGVRAYQVTMEEAQGASAHLEGMAIPAPSTLGRR